MTAHGSSITCMGSFNPSPPQDRPDPVLSPANSVQPLSTTTGTNRGSPIIRALSDGALSHKKERTPSIDSPRSTMIPIPSDQPSDERPGPTMTAVSNRSSSRSSTSTATTLSLETHLRELRSCSRHLLLLKTGSFFLLPSGLPYLASSLVAHFTLERSSDSLADFSTDAAAAAVGRSGGILPWMVPWIPFVGVMIPIVLAKALNKIQTCRARRLILNKPQNDPTTTTTTRTSGQQPQETRCPYERLRRLLGGGLIARSSCDAPSRPFLEEAKEAEDKVDNEGGHTGLDLYHLETELLPRSSFHRSQRLVPRSHTILMVSLGIWILLLASAPNLGLNQSETLVSGRPSEGTLLSDSNNDSMMRTMEGEDNSPFATILRSPSPNPATAHPNFWNDETIQQEQQRRRQQQQEELEAMVRAAEDDDVMDSEWVYPSTDIDDAWDDSPALRDFWDTPEEMVATEEMETDKEAAQQQQQQQHQQQQQQPQEYVIRLFKYVPFATEGFMFLLAMCLGGMSVGLDQVKNQIQHSQTECEQQLEDELLASHQREDTVQARAHILETMSRDDQQQWHAAWTWACRTLLVMALSLNYWMVISLCHWNIPSLYFVGLGCAGMLLVHAWVPEYERADIIPAQLLAGERRYYSYYDGEKGEIC